METLETTAVMVAMEGGDDGVIADAEGQNGNGNGDDARLMEQEEEMEGDYGSVTYGKEILKASQLPQSPSPLSTKKKRDDEDQLAKGLSRINLSDLSMLNQSE